MFEIRSEMSKRFNMSQLRELQFDLSYEAYQDLDGIQSKSEMVLETIDWFIKHGRYQEIVDYVNERLPKNSMTFEWTELIQLHMALTEHFNLDDLHYICQILGVDWENLGFTDNRDKARELILSLWRIRRIDKLIEVCYQIRAGFHWKDRDTQFGITDALIRVRMERLIEILTNHLNLNELHQLCFYLGIDFENIPPAGLFPGGKYFSEGQRRSLRDLEIDYDVLTPEEIMVRLKRLWAINFISHWERRNGNTAQIAAVCRYIRHDVF